MAIHIDVRLPYPPRDGWSQRVGLILMPQAERVTATHYYGERDI